MLKQIGDWFMRMMRSKVTVPALVGVLLGAGVTGGVIYAADPQARQPMLGVLIGVVGIVLLLAAATLNVKNPRIRRLGPSFVFWLELAFLSLLLFLPIAYNNGALNLKTDIPSMIGHILPVGVPWFGAIGAVVISLQGVFEHNQEWRNKYNYWHLARPLFGAVLATVAFFMFLLVMQAAGNAPKFLTDPTYEPPASDLLIYWVLGFLVGYREETFRELVKRATDLILTPAEGNAVDVFAVNFEVDGEPLSAVNFEEVVVGQSPKRVIEVVNDGKSAVRVRAGIDPEGPFSIVENTLSPGGSLPAGGAAELTVAFSPSQPGEASAELVVTSAGGDEARLELKGKGKTQG